MNNETTPARWSPQLQSIRNIYDNILRNNPFTKTWPALHASDYDFYLKSVLAVNPMHIGKIYYKDREVKKLGGNK
jgi:hypothetical protein